MIRTETKQKKKTAVDRKGELLTVDHSATNANPDRELADRLRKGSAKRLREMLLELVCGWRSQDREANEWARRLEAAAQTQPEGCRRALRLVEDTDAQIPLERRRTREARQAEVKRLLSGSGPDDPPEAA
jgi:hypothetical protein